MALPGDDQQVDAGLCQERVELAAARAGGDVIGVGVELHHDGRQAGRAQRSRHLAQLPEVDEGEDEVEVAPARGDPTEHLGMVVPGGEQRALRELPAQRRDEGVVAMVGGADVALDQQRHAHRVPSLRRPAHAGGASSGARPRAPKPCRQSCRNLASARYPGRSP